MSIWFKSRISTYRGWRAVCIIGSAAVLLAAMMTTGEGVAAAKSDGCVYSPGYSCTGASQTYLDALKTYGGPGTTIGINLAVGVGVTGTIGGSVEGDASLIVIGAKASVNASIAASFTATVTHTSSWTVPKSVSSGWLAAGAESDSMNWSYGALNGACKWISSRSGTANLPYKFPYFHHS